MVGRSLSMSKRQQLSSQEREKAVARAVDTYFAEQAKPTSERRSIRAICRDTSAEWLRETNNSVTIDHMTVSRRIRGGRSKTEANAEDKAHLRDEESENIIEYCLEFARRGFPLSHKRLKEHVDAVLRSRLGQGFGGVGRNWTSRFAEKHSDRLGRYWSSPLDTARGRAVNPTTNQEWYSLLENTITKENIEEDCLWASDETGFQPGGGTKERVFGPKGKKIQHQQRDGNRENITVMVTICADGTDISPLVIYKGLSYGTNWHQNNELGASVAISKKGWTDGTIGRLWLEDFDKKTRSKAGDRARLLLVDGHNSHYTWEFLEYARANNIHVLCYPAHATHVYQGLDVVIFGALKKRWSAERDEYERSTRQRVTKTNFISVYGKAHRAVLIPENIRSAFQKTGVWPLNPHVVTEDMMAPSLETCYRSHLPFTQCSPVRVVAKMLRQYREEHPPSIPPVPHTSTSTTASTDDPFIVPSTSHEPVTYEALAGVSELASTSVGFLLNNAPLTSTTRLPPFSPPLLAAVPQKRKHHLLDRAPETEHERTLQHELHQSYEHNSHQDTVLYGLQSRVVLQDLICDRYQSQLEAQQEKGQQKKGRLVGDGLPRLLTSDEFTTRVLEFHNAQAAQETAREARKVDQENRAALMKIWKEEELARKQRNEDRKLAHARAVSEWEAEKKLAKAEGRRARWARPKRGPLEGEITKPGAPRAGHAGTVQSVTEAASDVEDDGELSGSDKSNEDC